MKSFTDPVLLGKRLAGELPCILIGDDEFIIDWRLRELRHKEQCQCTIQLSGMAMSEDGEHYLCFYHLLTKAVIHIGDDITSLPGDVVMLKIPNELKLDPVGVARDYGLDDMFMLDKYPIVSRLEAVIIVLEETGLPVLIERNLEKHKKDKTPEIKKKRKVQDGNKI